MPRHSTVIEFYLDAQGQWRWRRKAANGRTVAVAGEGYHNRQDAYDGMVLACNGLPADLDVRLTGERTHAYLRSIGDPAGRSAGAASGPE